MPHTSSAGTADFGCYIGFGTYTSRDAYGAHVWTRDIGRLLIELADWGYFDRVKSAVDKLHELLYYPSMRFKVPHWKRVANLVARDENDLFNEGNENDGHASIMMAIYNLYRKGGVDKAWLEKNRDHLRALPRTTCGRRATRLSPTLTASCTPTRRPARRSVAATTCTPMSFPSRRSGCTPACSMCWRTPPTRQNCAV